MNFVVGDLVRLKSGGPRMTVTVLLDTNVRCAWFPDTQLPDGRPAWADFPKAALEEPSNAPSVIVLSADDADL